MYQDLIFIFLIFFVNLLVGIISWPITSFIFSNLSDKGFCVSSFLGWLVIAYIHFFLATLRILPLGFFGAFVVLLSWGGINLYFSQKKKTLSFDNKHFKIVLNTQIVFIVLFMILYFVRGFGSEIYQIERFMDYGILRSLFNNQYLPVSDMWYHGVNLNYYYFGHFVGFEILTLSFVPPLSGFFLLICWIFAISGTMVFRFGYDFVESLFKKKLSKYTRIFSGIVTTFLVLFAGTFHTAIWIFENLVYYAKIVLESVFFQDSGLAKPTYWYADATRFISNTITEMPIYGFLVADLHPHVWAIPLGILAVILVYSVFKDKKYKMDYLNPFTWIACFVLSIAFMTNSWDVLTLGVILVGALILRNLASFKKDFCSISTYPNCYATGFYCFGASLVFIFQVSCEQCGLCKTPIRFSVYVGLCSALVCFLGTICTSWRLVFDLLSKKHTGVI
jgi:uncharacterized membrane protein